MASKMVWIECWIVKTDYKTFGPYFREAQANACNRSMFGNTGIVIKQKALARRATAATEEKKV